jgi:hypothetical protein
MTCGSSTRGNGPVRTVRLSTRRQRPVGCRSQFGPQCLGGRSVFHNNGTDTTLILHWNGASGN